MPFKISIFWHCSKMREPVVSTITKPSVNWFFLTVGIPLCLEADVLSNKHKGLLFACHSSPRLIPWLKGTTLIIFLVTGILTVSTCPCSSHHQLVTVDHPREGPSVPEQVKLGDQESACRPISLSISIPHTVWCGRETPDYKMWSGDPSILFGKCVIKLQPHQ